MKTTILATLLAAMLALPAAGALIAADLMAPIQTTASLVDDLIDEDIDFEPEIAELVGCDGVHIYADDAGNAEASFYNWVWDEELQEYVKEECDPLGLPATLPVGTTDDELINEDIDFAPEIAEIAGCDGLNLYADDAGNAAATFYNWVWNEELEEFVKEDCDPLAVLLTVRDDDLIDEDVDFEPELAGLVGCEGLHVSADDEGNADAYFYNWVEDEETGELVKEECDPLAG